MIVNTFLKMIFFLIILVYFCEAQEPDTVIPFNFLRVDFRIPFCINLKNSICKGLEMNKDQFRFADKVILPTGDQYVPLPGAKTIPIKESIFMPYYNELNEYALFGITTEKNGEVDFIGKVQNFNNGKIVSIMKNVVNNPAYIWMEKKGERDDFIEEVWSIVEKNETEIENPKPSSTSKQAGNDTAFISIQFYSTKTSNGYNNATIIRNLRSIIADFNTNMELNNIPMAINQSCWNLTTIDPTGKTLHEVYADFKKMYPARTGLNSADAAFLLVDDNALGNVRGVATFNALKNKHMTGAVRWWPAKNTYTFMHELGHLCGAQHDRPNGYNQFFKDGYGWYFEMPYQSGLNSIMSYAYEGWKERFPLYSRNKKFEYIWFDSQSHFSDIGNNNNNNRRVIDSVRKKFAAFGNEDELCSNVM